MAREHITDHYNAHVVQKMFAEECIAMIECRREQHRVKMVNFRRKKKELKSQIQSEHHRLEREMKQHITNLRKEASNCTKTSTRIQLREIIEEKETLLQQNAALQEEIQHREAFQQIIENEHRILSKNERPLLPFRHGDVGWWVHVSNGAPSFFFHPFSAEEVNTTMDPMHHEFDNSLSAMPMTGLLFGWNVYRELKFRENPQMKPISSRMRFTKRIEVAYKVAYTLEQELRPVLLTSIDWNCNKSDKVSTQVLQEFGYNACLTLHSIPGSTNLRYMFLARTAQWQLHNDKRRMGFSMMATDSKANHRMRHAIVQQGNVNWLTEGWAYFMVTEVDANAIDVVYEHCVGCENQIHADKFFIQLAEFVYRWGQAVSLSNLLIS